jgi:hypothetical protein
MKRVAPKKEERVIDMSDGLDEDKEIGEDYLEADKEEENNTPKKVAVTCGRIRFEGIVAAPEAPTDLICEECEHRFATICCELCEQVFCHKCIALCHMLEDASEVMHPHEREEAVRPIAVGDTSHVHKVAEFNLPEGVFYEEDYNGIRDITQPNSLARNLHDNPQPSRKVYTNPMFKVGDQLLFTDPASGEEAYGRVVSEWDMRHGEVAPAIVRGDDTMVMYLVDMIKLVKGNVRDYRELVRTAQMVETQSNNIPRLAHEDGRPMQDNPLREDKYVAQDINRRLYDLHEYNKYGPRHHMKKEFPPLETRNPDGTMDRTVSMPMAPHPDVEAEVIEARAAACAPDSPRAAALRNYYNVIGDGSDPQRGTRLLVLPESALERPEHRHANIVAGNNSFLERIMQGIFLGASAQCLIPTTFCPVPMPMPHAPCPVSRPHCGGRSAYVYQCGDWPCPSNMHTNPHRTVLFSSTIVIHATRQGT